MKPINVTVRTDRETRRPILFFWADRELMCYDRIGQHSSCYLRYMRACEPMPRLTPEAESLVAEWENLDPEKTPARVLRRLPR